MTQSFKPRRFGLLFPDIDRLTDGGPTPLSVLVELLEPEWGEGVSDVLWWATLDGLFTLTMEVNTLTLTPSERK